MPDLNAILNATDDNASLPLREVRLGKEPALVLLFTSDVDEVKLHFEEDETVRSYVPCPGDRCPRCFLGSAPGEFYLLPVVNIDSGEVEVLRISAGRGPGALLSLLRPHIQAPDPSQNVLSISRNGSRYRIESSKISEHADRGTRAIESFLAERSAGLQLVSVFPALTAVEMSELPRTARKLEAVGGYRLNGVARDGQ